MNFYPGVELEGVVIEFHTPNEFYCSFIAENDYIKLSDTGSETYANMPDRSDVLKFKKFMIRVGDENVLCEVLDDLKCDEVHCQVMLCNTSVKLKVNYQSLRILSEKINNDEIMALKVYDFAPMFSNSWSTDLVNQMKERLLYKRITVQFKSYKPDPVDGRYPVTLLDLDSKRSVTDEFFDQKLAVHYSEYYDAWLIHESKRIFDCKDKDGRKYIISAPMFKKYPTRRNAITSLSSKHRFNIAAEPFTPNSSKLDLPLTPTSPQVSVLNGSLATEKLVLTPRRTVRKLDENDKVFGTYPLMEALTSSTPRSNKVLEVVSPSTKRKVTNVSGNDYHEHQEIIPEPMRQLSFNERSPSRDFVSSINGFDHRSVTLGSNDGTPSPVMTPLMLGRPASPKKCHPQMGTFSYTMPFVPFTFPQMQMYPTGFMKAPLANDAYLQRININNNPGKVAFSNSVSPENVFERAN